MFTKWMVVISDTSESYPFTIGPFDTDDEAKRFVYSINDYLHMRWEETGIEFGASVAPWIVGGDLTYLGKGRIITLPLRQQKLAHVMAYRDLNSPRCLEDSQDLHGV